jgi:hypothetical protein
MLLYWRNNALTPQDNLRAYSRGYARRLTERPTEPSPPTIRVTTYFRTGPFLHYVFHSLGWRAFEPGRGGHLRRQG